MFGNILIDKLRFSKKVDCIDEPFVVQHKLKKLMQLHFLDNAFSVNFDKQYFRIDFTPTRYLDEVLADSSNKPNLNLEMIDEKKLLKLLLQILDILGDCNVTWIDLTKNIIVKEPVKKYIKAFYKRKYKHPYKVNDENSNTDNATLVLNPIKRKNCVDCRNKARQICFYDKIKELESKARVPFIDGVELRDEEIEQIPSNNYERDKGRLYLNNLYGFNIFRCEQRYKYATNIERMTHFLYGSKEKDKLMLCKMIDLLEKGELYSRLDEFYTTELRKYVFFNEIENIKKTKNKFIPIIKDLIEEYKEIDLMAFQQQFYEIGYKNKFDSAIKTIQQQIQGVYYNELYQKFKIKI